MAEGPTSKIWQFIFCMTWPCTSWLFVLTWDTLLWLNLWCRVSIHTILLRPCRWSNHGILPGSHTFGWLIIPKRSRWHWNKSFQIAPCTFATFTVNRRGGGGSVATRVAWPHMSSNNCLAICGLWHARPGTSDGKERDHFYKIQEGILRQSAIYRDHAMVGREMAVLSRGMINILACVTGRMLGPGHRFTVSGTMLPPLASFEVMTPSNIYKFSWLFLSRKHVKMEVSWPLNDNKEGVLAYDTVNLRSVSNVCPGTLKCLRIRVMYASKTGVQCMLC